jgi:IS605 OrfB family transposase
VEEPIPDESAEFLGIDLGISNIAVDSDGTMHGGNHLKSVRYRHRRLRTKLQRKGTRSAKRRLKSLSGKEQRFAKNTNHVISKSIVSSAKGTGRGIALEDLQGIRSRVTVRHGRQRITLHSWAFDQLRQHIIYKARLAGVRVVMVDPRNTSRTCPACGSIDKANRRTQANFLCISCGFAGHADVIAAGIIAGRGALNRPNVGGTYHCADPLLTSPQL